MRRGGQAHDRIMHACPPNPQELKEAMAAAPDPDYKLAVDENGERWGLSM
jgi:hypothetical protein